MPAEHFTRADLAGVALGTAIFAVFLLPPGYLFGWMFDLLDFRRRSRPWQAMLSLVLSTGIAPIVVFLLWTYAGLWLVWTFFALAGLFSLAIATRASPGRIPGWVFAALAIWLAIVWGSGIDLQLGTRLYASVLSYDFNLRTALIDGIARRGLPARNPLFYPGHSEPLRYHYFWLMICALANLAGGRFVDARQAQIAGDVWCGWSVMAVVALFLRFFHPAGERGFERRAKCGIALLAVAGVEILPVLFFDLLWALTGRGNVFGSVEWWNNPVACLLHSTLWVAHHMNSVVACFAGFLILWRGSRLPRSWRSGICAGLCFASAAGLSIYVVFTFGIFLAVWGARAVIRGKRPERVAWISAGAMTAAACAPYLLELGRAGGTPGRFAYFTIRGFAPLEAILGVLNFGPVAIHFADLIALPLNYFIETGVWFVLACLWIGRAWRRRARLPIAERAALAMFAISFLVGTFLRSGTIANNDLGWRSLLIGDLILLVWSVDPIRAWWRSLSRNKSAPRKSIIGALVLLGVASNVYEIVALRSYFPLMDRKWVPQATWFASDVGRRTFAARQVYSRLREIEPREAVLQANPTHWNDVFHGLYGMRQTAAFDPTCGQIMGGSGDCAAMQAQLAPLFNNNEAARHADIDAVCSAWGIDVLVAKDDDPVFADRLAWPWQRPPIAAADGVRAIPCGKR